MHANLTPSHAISHDTWQVVEVLLEAQADPHHQDLILGSALEIAVREKPRNKKRLLQLLYAADESAAAKAEAATGSSIGASPLGPKPIPGPAIGAIPDLLLDAVARKFGHFQTKSSFRTRR